MASLHEKPYIYYFIDEIKSCITIVNHHKKSFTYYPTLIYGFDIDTIKLIVLNEVRKLHNEHGNKTYNKLIKTKDPISGEEYFLFQLDGPGSSAPSSILKFSSLTMLHSKQDNSSMIDILTSHSWKVSLDQHGNNVIESHEIVSLNNTKLLDQMLIDTDNYILFKLTSDPFDYREGRYKIIKTEDFQSLCRLHKQSNMDLSMLVASFSPQDPKSSLYNTSSSSSSTDESKSENKLVCDDEEIEIILPECRKDPVFLSIKEKITIDKKESKDKIKIILTSRYDCLQKRRQFSICPINNSPSDIDHAIQQNKEYLAAKIYITSLKTNTNIHIKPTDILSKHTNNSDEDIKKFINHLKGSNRYCVKLLYLDKDSKLSMVRHHRINMEDMIKDIRLLMDIGFYLKSLFGRVSECEVLFLKDIYIHLDTDIDVASLISSICKDNLK